MRSLYEGKRIRLTASREGDAAIIAGWYADSEYERRMDTDVVRPRSVADQEKMKAPETVFEFFVRTVEDDRLIGFVALHNIEWANQMGKLAIGIGEKEYRGKGYGSEMLALILQYAFCELGLHRVGLDVTSYNEAAIRAYERAGFVYEGREREAIFRDNARYDLVFMGILREEWLAREK